MHAVLLPATHHFFINSSTTKARCSPDHAMAYTENGTYTAVRRHAPHHCTRSPPEAMPLPNRGVLSAGPCIIYPTSCRVYPQIWMFYVIQQTMLNTDTNNVLLASHWLLMSGSSHTDKVFSN